MPSPDNAPAVQTPALPKPVLTKQFKEQAALGVNMAGHLCAEVTDMRPLQRANTYEITCIVYRGGAGTKTYIMDGDKGTIFEQ